MIFGASRPRRRRSDSRATRRSVDDVVGVEDLPPKLVPSLRSLVSTATALLHTRLALAGIELEEEMQRLISAAIFGFVALLLVALALVVGTFTIVLAVPPDYRVLTMIIITVVYLAIAVFLVLRVKGIFTNRPPIFAATLAELDKDKETLSQMARAHDAAEEAAERERATRRAESVAASVRPARRSATAGPRDPATRCRPLPVCARL